MKERVSFVSNNVSSCKNSCTHGLTESLLNNPNSISLYTSHDLVNPEPVDKMEEDVQHHSIIFRDLLLPLFNPVSNKSSFHVTKKQKLLDIWILTKWERCIICSSSSSQPAKKCQVVHRTPQDYLNKCNRWETVSYLESIRREEQSQS